MGDRETVDTISEDLKKSLAYAAAEELIEASAHMNTAREHMEGAGLLFLCPCVLLVDGQLVSLVRWLEGYQ